MPTQYNVLDILYKSKQFTHPLYIKTFLFRGGAKDKNMARFHIGSNGLPAECNAKPGNCPVKLKSGIPMPHFETAELASQWYDTHQNEQHLPTMTSGFNFSYEPLDEDLFMDDLDVLDVKVDETGHEIPSHMSTLTEDQAIEALTITEGEIEAHQDAIRRGAKPIDLYNNVCVDALTQRYIDMREYKRAFLNGDYDKARLLAAQATKRAYGAGGNIYFDEEELINRAQKEYNNSYGYI